MDGRCIKVVPFHNGLARALNETLAKNGGRRPTLLVVHESDVERLGGHEMIRTWCDREAIVFKATQHLAMAGTMYFVVADPMLREWPFPELRF